MNKVKGLIFDLDGVIVSTDKYHYLAWKAIADQEGIYFDEQINNRLRGVSRMASLEIVLEKANKKYSEEEKLALATAKNDIYRASLNELKVSDRLPGVTESLNYLKAKGYKLAIGSSSKNTPLILKKIGLDTFFDAISDGNNITHSKPNPEVFLKAAEMLGLDPKECVVIEDSTAGIEAANNGDFLSVAIGDAKKIHQSTYEIDEMNQLQNIF